MIVDILIVAITVGGALLAVTQRSMVRAIFGLAIALGGVAVAFLKLGSPFVAAMEVLIYIGGITVAMVFAIMLSTAGRHEDPHAARRHALAGLIALLFFGAVAMAVKGIEAPGGLVAADGAWSVRAVGAELLDRFNVVFETLSVVLLLAIIGAITIAHRASGNSTEGGK